MIPKEFVTDLISETDIEDLVGSYVKLKGTGPNRFGVCPFHTEKSGSFSISKPKQFYHCFGCGAHGNAIDFIRNLNGLNFQEAIEYLANRLGKTVPSKELSGKEKALALKRDYLKKVCEKASLAYKKHLMTDKNAITYLKGRGLTGETVRDFRLGSSPSNTDFLRPFFIDYEVGFEVVDSGLVMQEEDGPNRWDRFRNRLIFPIRNTKGETIGFGARAFGDEKPKYLNSPETDVFSKGYELYGLYENRSGIAEAGYSLVVEGFMDVIALYEQGVRTAVATLGTAVTVNHIQKLSRITNRVVFCFDGDDAGRRASWRALEACLVSANENRKYEFIEIPNRQDPDEFIREHGKEAFEALIANAMPLSQFLVNRLRQQFSMDIPEGRTAAINHIKPMFEEVPSGVYKHALVQHIAQQCQMDEATLLSALKAKTEKPKLKKVETKLLPSVEVRVLAMLLANPSWLEYTQELDVHLEDLSTLDKDQQMMTLCFEFILTHPDWTAAILAENFRDTEYESRVDQAVKLSFEFKQEQTNLDEFMDCLPRLLDKIITSRMANLVKRGLTEKDDQDLYRALIEARNVLNEKIND